MTIAFITDEFPTLSTFINNQIEGLIELGHEVIIFPRCEHNPNKDFLLDERLEGKVFYPINYIYNRKAKWLFVLKLIISYIFKNPVQILKSLNYFKFGREALNFKILFKIAPFLGKKIDIVQVHFGINQEIPVLLKKVGWKIPIVIMFHGYDIRLGIEKGGSIYKELFQYGDLFLAISNYNKTHLLSFGLDEKKIIHHPVGIDTKLFNFKIRKIKKGKSINILTIGRLVWEKGYEYALPAIKKLITYEYNVKYTIVGEGYKRKEIEKQIKELQLEDYVHLAGEKFGTAIVEELDNADIFLLPSIAEALPVVLMEASYSGLPVVATKVGSIDELIINNQSGYMVESKNSDAIFNALKKMIDYHEIWYKFGQQGHEHIKKHYCVNVLNAKLVKEYNQLVKKIKVC